MPSPADPVSSNGRPHPIRILAVDDSVTVRETLAVLVESQPDMELIGSAASGNEAVRRAAELQPDIVLMDIHMPDLDGIQATWLVSSRAPHGAVIMVTSEERIDFLQKAMSAGAQGYVLKPFGNGAQLFQTIREVHGRSAARRIQASGGAPLDASLRPRIGKRLVILGAKGGLGATTIAVNLALLLRERTDAAVVLVDADFLSTSTSRLNVRCSTSCHTSMRSMHAWSSRSLPSTRLACTSWLGLPTRSKPRCLPRHSYALCWGRSPRCTTAW